MTELTNITVTNPQGTLFYDGTCGFCLRGIKRLRKALGTVGVEVQPFENGAEQPEMILKWNDGRIFGGADAAIFLAKRNPIGFLPATIAGLFPFIYLARAIYKVIARNRHCIGDGACKIDFGDIEKADPKTGWIFTIVIVGIAAALGFVMKLAPWVHMWVIAFAMWFGFKVMSYRNAGGFAEVDLYFFFWPGMDTTGFAYDNRGLGKTIGLLTPTLFVLIGTGLLFAIPAFVHPIAKGWTGVIAMICLLHFGSFVWIAAFWNRLGFSAEPIMRKPWLSRGLGDFWGNRWNRAFSDWARDFLFRPLTARFGTTAGTVTGFLASGIAHELVISLPARGGFGLPILYFLIQGIGLLIEKKARLRRRKLARIWMWLVVIIPAPLLFHSTFIEKVFNPMTNLITNPWTH
ncbi:MAG: MBOAT family protein [Verrucomicrobiales bacterium]|nr:MBOAT family protein [Verrucomicrobiales bacterium]